MWLKSSVLFTWHPNHSLTDTKGLTFPVRFDRPLSRSRPRPHRPLTYTVTHTDFRLFFFLITILPSIYLDLYKRSDLQAEGENLTRF